MARALRIEYEGALYHVTSRGNERKKIFFTKRDFDKFKEYVLVAQKRFGFILHCYVLMTNHYHLLIETPGKNLQRVMHYINSSYTMYTNVKRRRSGHLFQGRYKALVVDKDSYLLELSRYIHLNPVRAMMVEKPEDYPYSSYRAYADGADDELVTRWCILQAFADITVTAQARYKRYVELGIEEELGNPLDNVQRGSFLGDEDFINDVLGNLDTESIIGNESIGNRKGLFSCMPVKAIVAQLEDHLALSSKAILTKQISLKKLSVYLLKRYSDATNKEIAELVGDRHSSTAAKIYERFVKDLASDDQLRRQVADLERELSLVKARPLR